MSNFAFITQKKNLNNQVLFTAGDRNRTGTGD